MNEMYRQKYLKYKHKYLQLQYGGDENKTAVPAQKTEFAKIEIEKDSNSKDVKKLVVTLKNRNYKEQDTYGDIIVVNDINNTFAAFVYISTTYSWYSYKVPNVKYDETNKILTLYNTQLQHNTQLQQIINNIYKNDPIDPNNINNVKIWSQLKKNDGTAANNRKYASIISAFANNGQNFINSDAVVWSPTMKTRAQKYAEKQKKTMQQLKK